MLADVAPAKRLQASRVKPKTLELYSSAVEEFEEWCIASSRACSKHKLLDEAMTIFIHELCEDYRSITDANYVIYGWILLRSTLHLPEKLQLPFSKQAIKGWRSRFPSCSKAGVDLMLWDLVALQCCELGFYYTAAGILVQGDTYLRPSELLGLHRKHVIQPQASRRQDVWGIIVAPFEDSEPTKAGEFDDCVLLDTASRKDVNQLLRWLFIRAKSGSTLFENLRLEQYSKQIALAAEQVGLQALHLTPHILRHSGASHDAYHAIRDFCGIQARGRWKCSRSVQRYKKPGRMLLQHSKVSDATWLKARSARSKVFASLESFLSLRKNA